MIARIVYLKIFLIYPPTIEILHKASREICPITLMLGSCHLDCKEVLIFVVKIC